MRRSLYVYMFPAVVMFVLDCNSILAGLSGPLRVNCLGSRDIASVECNYDSGTLVEECKC